MYSPMRYSKYPTDALETIYTQYTLRTKVRASGDVNSCNFQVAILTYEKLMALLRFSLATLKFCIRALQTNKLFNTFNFFPYEIFIRNWNMPAA